MKLKHLCIIASLVVAVTLAAPVPGNPLGDFTGIWGNGLENLAGDVGNFANTFAKGFVAGPIEAAKDVMGGNDGGAQAKANALYGQQGVQRQPVVVQQKPVVYQQQPVEY
ncbi:hypothetical protein F5H01DRAFT_323659 [Linnemannia elongata]|nr:hypothetical protein F5H01DRAFT_323659 [Linnemannia elongata]